MDETAPAKAITGRIVDMKSRMSVRLPDFKILNLALIESDAPADAKPSRIVVFADKAEQVETLVTLALGGRPPADVMPAFTFHGTWKKRFWSAPDGGKRHAWEFNVLDAAPSSSS